MIRIVPCVLILIAATACRKQTAHEYYGLESTYSIIVARDGDAAYTSETMNQVLAGLKGIPADTVEGPQAMSLVAEIESERARIESDLRAQAESLAAVEKPIKSPSFEFTPPPPPAQKKEADQQPTRPWGGMSSAEFKKLFGACFTPGPPKTLPGQQEGDSFQLKDNEACRKKYAVKNAQTKVYFLFLNDELVGQTSENIKRIKIPQPPPPPPEEPTEEPKQYLIVPGAPLPKHLRPPSPTSKSQ